MNSNSSVQARVAISLLPKLNSCIYLPLIEKCGGLEGFFQESDRALQHIYQEFHMAPDSFDRKAAWQKASTELEQIDKHAIQLCTIEDDSYPALLKQCEDAPLVFFYNGSLKNPPDQKYIAVVGTRHASALCENRVNSILEDLVQMGYHPVVVSGLAYGIDITAHRASLKYGLTTWAVLGHGLHMIYPAGHKNVAQKILETGGCWISEFPCTRAVHPSNFLRRNRIIAGLCHAVLIAESAEKGGAMSTARLAMSYNRDVMAIPGRPDDTYSKGCNRLIKENIAALVENAVDVARMLNYPMPELRFQPSATTKQSESEMILLQLLQEQGALYIDELMHLSGFSSNELAAQLLQLELEGKIIGLPGKKYTLR